MAINVFEGARRITKLLAALWVGGWVIAAFSISPSVDVTYKVATPGAAPIRITEECPPDSTTDHVYDKVTRRGTKTVVTLCFPKVTANMKPQANPFDQFDAVDAKKDANPFDQFDNAQQAPQDEMKAGKIQETGKPKPRFSVAEALEEIKAEEMKAGKVTESLVTFKIKAPDGSILTVKAPDGATEEQAIEFAASTWKPQLPLKDAFVLPQSDEKWIDGQWWTLFMKEIGLGALGAVSGLLFLLAFTLTVGWIVRGFMGIPRGRDHRVANEVANRT